MSTVQAFLLGMMVAWTPSLIVLAWVLRDALAYRLHNKEDRFEQKPAQQGGPVSLRPCQRFAPATSRHPRRTSRGLAALGQGVLLEPGGVLRPRQVHHVAERAVHVWPDRVRHDAARVPGVMPLLASWPSGLRPYRDDFRRGGLGVLFSS